MKFAAAVLFAVLALATAQRRVRLTKRPDICTYVYVPSICAQPVLTRVRPVVQRIPVYVAPQDETYAASLGGAKVGAYKRTGGGGGLGRGLGYDVAGVSLGGAPVGIYGRQDTQPRLPVVPRATYVVPTVRCPGKVRITMKSFLYML
ncbi:hypothetical protein CDAR_419161 [Caerostris darwini]|uniref:Uncharacterized protein n=1 Tax=Caerostris darwini TaxID=1538125 RepID=A0AAV4MVB6_9ARAC|nr:hypothetical protein CDAR_419161 [Caerostris darwini]